MNFELQKLKIPGLILIHSQKFCDNRGFFQEIYKESAFQKLGIDTNFVQYNHSVSCRGTIRGLHYQIFPYEQAKMVTVIEGQIRDVVVDLRRDSPTFLQHLVIDLEDSSKLLYIPTGLAHGFSTLSERACIVYACSKEYSASHERGIHVEDPSLGIDWKVKNPIISEKDLNLPFHQKADF